MDEGRKHHLVHGQDAGGRQRAAPHPPPPQDPVRHRVSEVEAVPGARGARRHRLQEGHGPEEVGRGNLKGIFCVFEFCENELCSSFLGMM